jgi:hypothetical protein
MRAILPGPAFPFEPPDNHKQVQIAEPGQSLGGDEQSAAVTP